MFTARDTIRQGYWCVWAGSNAGVSRHRKRDHEISEERNFTILTRMAWRRRELTTPLQLEAAKHWTDMNTMRGVVQREYTSVSSQKCRGWSYKISMPELSFMTLNQAGELSFRTAIRAGKLSFRTMNRAGESSFRTTNRASGLQIKLVIWASRLRIELVNSASGLGIKLASWASNQAMNPTYCTSGPL